MADTYIKNERTLRIDTMFVDGDTRAITLKSPKSTITEEEITELNTFIQANNLLIGDKNGATFGRISKVTRINTEKTLIEF